MRLDDVEPSAAGARARRRGRRRAARRGDPARGRPHRAHARSARDRRDAARLRLRVRRRRRVERAGARHARPAAARPRRVGARASATRIGELTGRSVAVIVSDSFGRPWRQGTTDVAIGVAGLAPLLDLRGTQDAAGYELRSTQIAVADELAGAAELVMGKAERRPGRGDPRLPRGGRRLGARARHARGARPLSLGVELELPHELDGARGGVDDLARVALRFDGDVVVRRRAGSRSRRSPSAGCSGRARSRADRERIVRARGLRTDVPRRVLRQNAARL